MVWGLGLLLFAALVAVGISYYAASEITRIPYLAVPYTPKDYQLPFEDVTFESKDHLKLAGWFIPAKVKTDATIVVLHGLGSNAGDMLLNVLALASAGQWNLFLFNFRGHADSEGNRTSLGPLELGDLDAALAFVREKYPPETRRLGIYGHSLGAAVSVVGAARHPEIGTVLVESPFARTRSTIFRYAKLYYGFPAFPMMYLALGFARLRLGVSLWDFEPVREIAKIAPRPLFMIHAERDARMPADEAQALFDAAREPKALWVVPGADHGEPWMVAKEEYDQKLLEFFRRTLP